MDSDGDLDIAAGNLIEKNVVYLNDGNGNFTAEFKLLGNRGGNTRSMVFGDVDGDGSLDIAVGNYNQQNTVYLNASPPDIRTAISGKNKHNTAQSPNTTQALNRNMNVDFVARGSAQHLMLSK